VIIDPRVGKRVRNKDTKWIPVPLIMAFVRERGNVIDYEIPITGDLKSPSFNVWDAVGDLVNNIFVKPATTAYRMQVKNIEAEIEKSISLRWPMRQSTLTSSQEKFLEKMAHFLKDNPEVKIKVHPQFYTTKEREHTIFYEAKKAFYLRETKQTAADFDEDDMEAVDKRSVKDSAFVHFIKAQVSDTMLFTMEAKCAKFLDETKVQASLKNLTSKRKEAFMAFFTEKGVAKQVQFLKDEQVVPFNGFSFYKLDYLGELPEKLRIAYEEIKELNNEAPRKRYKRVRKQVSKQI
jgi:hypothetical protein